MEATEKNPFSRTELLLGSDAMTVLANAKVIIFGIGGVGGHAFEALVRSGVGSICVVDADVVSETNLNRQILATKSTIGVQKTEAARLRALDINPNAKITTVPIFYDEASANKISLSDYDYVIDAIDTVTSKLLLIKNAKEAGVPIISSMGAGGKTDPTAFKVSDVYKTSVCPLARVMRTQLKKMGIKKLKVVYSEEMPKKSFVENEENLPKTRHAPGSIATVPSVAGLIIAAEVMKDLTEKCK